LQKYLPLLGFGLSGEIRMQVYILGAAAMIRVSPAITNSIVNIFPKMTIPVDSYRNGIITRTRIIASRIYLT
jgi:hypothetical protein